MKLLDLAKENFMKSCSVAAAYFGKDIKTGKDSIHCLNWISKHNIDIDALSEDRLDCLVSLVNKMVKDPECPKNLRNRFYAAKHKYIKELMHRNKLERVSDAGHLYGFRTVYGNEFHQLKITFKNPVQTIGKEDYVYNEDYKSFDGEVYRDCMVQIALYITYKYRK